VGSAGAVGTSGAGPSSTLPSGGNGGATDVGVTGDTLSLGQVVTLSGPVPGLFAGAVVGTQAFLAYQNSLGGVHGRKLELDVRDDQFDTGQNKNQTADLVKKTFALVGGFSVYDDAGVAEIEAAGAPVIQVPINIRLQSSPMNFAVAPVARGAPTGPYTLLKEMYPDAIEHAAVLYADIPASVDNYLGNRGAAESVGYKFVYTRAYAATETDFTADVVRMRQSGVRFLFSNGDPKATARIAKAMAQQGFKPDAFLAFNAYDKTFTTLAGDAGEGTYNDTAQAMYLGEDEATVPEVKLMRQWIAKVKPGFAPDLYTAYGWGNARLFMKALQDAGPKATRAGVLAQLRKVDSWDGYGLFPEVGPASKRPSVCFILLQVHNGKFERVQPARGFRCTNSTFVYRK
jgi:ABC-type branched-subunit amino acid transport system substrate-binding protein